MNGLTEMVHEAMGKVVTGSAAFGLMLFTYIVAPFELVIRALFFRKET
ncbi:MAG TPA: hypothetical protein PKO06_24605 [Candidatus Ozemobacteraceae bacterium]|nr:hypothetical protein [Candidatus Ozemobacteraceae bacterium]